LTAACYQQHMESANSQPTVTLSAYKVKPLMECHLVMTVLSRTAWINDDTIPPLNLGVAPLHLQHLDQILRNLHRPCGSQY
jgi:hypothetical protein